MKFVASSVQILYEFWFLWEVNSKSEEMIWQYSEDWGVQYFNRRYYPPGSLCSLEEMKVLLYHWNSPTVLNLVAVFRLYHFGIKAVFYKLYSNIALHIHVGLWSHSWNVF